jgi:hypothetical protein
MQICFCNDTHTICFQMLQVGNQLIHKPIRKIEYFYLKNLSIFG